MLITTTLVAEREALPACIWLLGDQPMGTTSNETTDPTDDSPIATRAGRPRFDARAIALDMWQRWWAVLTRPRVETFDAQQEAASWTSVVIQVALPGVIGGLLTALFLQINPISPLTFYVAGEFLDFFAIVGLFFASARLFGGRGGFLPYTYVLALIYAPLQILGLVVGVVFQLLGNAVGFLADVGLYLPLVFLLYLIFLAMYATASVHQLPVRRAGIAVLIGFAVLLVLSSLLASGTGVPILGI